MKTVLTIIRHTIIACAWTSIIQLSAATITLENISGQPAYIASYDTSGVRLGQPIEIPAGGGGTMAAPAKRLFSISRPFLTAHTASAPLLEQYSAPFYARSPISSSVTKMIINTMGTDLGITAEKSTDSIKIYNKTDKHIAVALYYDDGTVARRWGNAIIINTGESSAMMRPERKCKNALCMSHYDRTLYIAESASMLTPLLSSGSLASGNVGSIQGDELYITADSDTFKTMNTATWQIQQAQTAIKNIVTPQLEKIRTQVLNKNFPGKNIQATVTHSAELSPEEQAFREKRFAQAIRPACEKLYQEKYGTPLPQNATLPIVSLCVSGGGCRAMVAMAGFVAAMERLDSLSLLMYIATLSGSTWQLAGWLQSGLSAQEYHAQVITQLQSGISNKFTLEQIQQAVLRKAAFDQPTSIVDVYGALLADKLLKPYAPEKNPNMLFWGATDTRVDAATVPFPLYTAVTPKQFTDLEPTNDPINYYHWVTFDPYRVELEALQASIPSWALGRTFSGDISTETMMPPLSLGNLMGIWGSAMSFNTADINRVVVGSVSSDISERITTIIHQNDILKYLIQQRASPAKLPNFAAPGLMTLVDGGMCLILPVPPLLKKARKSDIIITLDASAAVKLAPSLRSLQRYVEGHNIPFPSIDLKTVGKKNYTILWDKDKKEAPIIIHVPLVERASYHNNWDPESALFTNTFNFTYTTAQATMLSGLAQIMAEDVNNALIDTIVTWIYEHQKA